MNTKLLAESLFATYRIVLAEDGGSEDGLRPMIQQMDFDYALICGADSELPCWLSECRDQAQPSIYISALNCLWVSVPCNESLVVVGPVLLGPIREAQLVKNLRAANIAQTMMEPAIKAHAQLPILPHLEMMRLCTHLYHMVMGNAEQTPTFTKHQGTFTLSISDDEMYDNQTRDFNASLRTEMFLKECVRAGRVELLGSLQSFSVPKTARIAKDALRKSKNSFITTATLVSRAAIEGGLPIEIAYPLSDEYLMQNEALTDEAQVWALHQTCVLDYTNRVRSNQFRLRYGQLINRCCGYILSNLSENLKVKNMATVLGVNPEYLSRQFKKETGMSILSFIQNAKISEAKILLRYSDMDMVSIAAKLGYTSQSQFSIHFKDKVCTTPGQYRKMNAR